MKLIKKALCVALSAALTLSMVGCGDDESKSKNKGASSEAKSASTECVFGEDTDFSITGYEGDIEQFVVASDSIIFSTNEWVENESASDSDAEEDSIDTATSSDSEDYAVYDGADIVDGNNISRIYSVPREGGQATLINEMDSTEGYIGSLFADPNGNPAYVIEQYSDTGTSSAKLYVYDGNEFVAKTDVSKLSNVTDDMYISKIMYAANGNLFVQYDKDVKVYDENMKEVDDIKCDEYIDGVTFDKDGNLVIFYTSYNEETEESKVIAKVYDVEKKSFGDDYTINVNYIQGGNGVMPGTGEYDFFYSVTSGIYGYKYKNKSADKILDYSASDIASESAGYMTLVSETEYMFVEWNWDSESESSIIRKYTKIDPSQVEERVILTLASLYGNWELKQNISEYNKSQTKYKITMLDYSDESNPEEKMSADIAAGDIPDMFDVSYGVGNMSTNQCIAKGLFEDLTPYVDGDDKINKEDFIPSAYESMLHDGKLYYVATSFSVQTLAARASEVGEDGGWTFSDMKEYVESKPEGTRLFYSTNKSDTLDTFMYGCGKDFVNWDKGECYFNTQDFKDVLEICNTCSNDEMDWEEDSPSTVELIKSGEMLFLEGSISTSDLAINKKLFDDDIVYKGYPNKDKNGSFFSFQNCVAISSKCEDKQAAWDFVKQFMTEDYQSKNYQNSYGIPIREDVYEAYIESVTCTKEGKDKYGNDIYPTEGSYGWDDIEIENKPLTDEEVADFRSMIDAAKGVWEYDSNIQEIVSEEAKAYFSGDKTVDEVCDIIQNRATTYVNENK